MLNKMYLEVSMPLYSMDKQDEHIVKFKTPADYHCTSESSEAPPKASRSGLPEALGSQRRNRVSSHSMHPTIPTSVPQSSSTWFFPSGNVPREEKERRHKWQGRRQTCDSEAIRKLSSDLHSLLSIPTKGRRRGVSSPDEWGSNIATRPHPRRSGSMDYSRAKINYWRGKDDKGSPFMPRTKGDARSAQPNHSRKFSNQQLSYLNGNLGVSHPIRCDFSSNPMLLKSSGVGRSTLNQPALSPYHHTIRMRQVTIVFGQWNSEIVVSTPATLFPANSSPNNVKAITVLDVLDCVYLHLSEPLLEDSAEWQAASSRERDVARRSFARRRGKTMRRIDWLGGNTAFAGLEYQGGATPCQGAGADGGRWTVLFGSGDLSSCEDFISSR